MVKVKVSAKQSQLGTRRVSYLHDRSGNTCLDEEWVNWYVPSMVMPDLGPWQTEMPPIHGLRRDGEVVANKHIMDKG